MLLYLAIEVFSILVPVELQQSSCIACLDTVVSTCPSKGGQWQHPPTAPDKCGCYSELRGDASDTKDSEGDSISVRTVRLSIHSR